MFIIGKQYNMTFNTIPVVATLVDIIKHKTKYNSTKTEYKVRFTLGGVSQTMLVASSKLTPR